MEECELTQLINDMPPRMRHIFETARREMLALSQSDSDDPSFYVPMGDDE